MWKGGRINFTKNRKSVCKSGRKSFVLLVKPAPRIDLFCCPHKFTLWFFILWNTIYLPIEQVDQNNVREHFQTDSFLYKNHIIENQLIKLHYQNNDRLSAYSCILKQVYSIVWTFSANRADKILVLSWRARLAYNISTSIMISWHPRKSRIRKIFLPIPFDTYWNTMPRCFLKLCSYFRIVRQKYPYVNKCLVTTTSYLLNFQKSKLLPITALS